ncbi:unnamed protein product [Timema podura]|uniref:Beclin 1-associated autophagy-related key regulator n=1 Tax=Timema podura TaxID=61482 RepID=A0ABN7NE47_TIMPD|nr:unnamed protein product [Timema podura]
MATSSSGCSCDAPADFHLSSSIEDSGSRLSLALEKCPLCNNARKTFYCVQCIQNGDFFHSNNHYADRFAEKQLALLRKKNELNKIEDKCKDLLWRRLQTNHSGLVMRRVFKKSCTNLEGGLEIIKDGLRLFSNNEYYKERTWSFHQHEEMAACRERITLLRTLVQEKKKNINKGETEKANLTKTNRERSVRLPRYEEKVGKMEHYVRQWQHNVKKQQRALEAVHQDLKEVIRSSVQQLVTYIFPITAVQPAPPGTGKEEEDTVTALADASRTAYVRGHWILTDSSGELHHCIVAPTLPGSGDYSAYSAWVATNKETGVPGGGTDSVDHNPAYNLAAALTYTTQLINVLAYYLDVRLPNKLCYSDFCGHEMSDPTFARRVAKLNANVLHLCFLQNVEPERLRSTHTLHNVLNLLDTTVSDLGRQGPLEVDPIQARSLEDQLTHDLDLNEGSGSEDESDNLPWEWETVPNISCPETAAGPAVVPSQQLMNTQQATSMAGGLVTSAAASIVSIWRGWTGNK